jgi:DNA-directed RNA polymerase specialized sigma subunit
MATTGRDSIDAIMTQYAVPFAKALAVFVREVELLHGNRPSASAETMWTTSDDDNDDSFHQELADAVATHRKLEKQGELEMLELAGDEVTRSIAERLRFLMASQHLTQKELARRMGVSAARVSQALKNPDHLKVDTLRKIAAAMGIGLREVL